MLRSTYRMRVSDALALRGVPYQILKKRHWRMVDALQDEGFYHTTAAQIIHLQLWSEGRCDY